MRIRCRFFLILLLVIFINLTAFCNGYSSLSEDAKVPEIELWITTQTYDPIRYEAGLMIGQKWEELGFKIKITPMEWATMSSKGMSGHEHDAFVIQWGGQAERIDPFHWLYTMHHSSETDVGKYNIAGYESSEYDRIAKQFVENMDMDKRRESAYALQEILSHDLPQPPIAHRIVTHAYNSMDFENTVMAMGEGMNSFWNWINITPKGDRKIVKFGYVGDVKLLNPLSTKTGADIYLLKMIYDPLVRVNIEGKPIPWAAESFNEIDDQTFEIVLREGMKFHDGKEVTVEDVKFTFDFAKEVKAPYYLSKINYLEKVEIVDNRTVRFTLNQPFAPFISNALALVGILPRHIWEEKYQEKGAEGILNWDNLPPVGSGPFKFEYWRPNEELKLTKFAQHFNPAKIDGVIRIPYASAYGVVQGLKAGESDSAGWSLLPLQVEELKEVKHLTLKQVDDQGCYMLHYNMRKAPFDDVNVRRALTYAIPKKQIVELVFEGMAVPAYSVVAPVNSFWHNPDIEKAGDDIEKARQILEDAGFRWDDKGWIYYPENYEVKKLFTK